MSLSVFPFQRILIISCPGGGKSTFARALAARTELPLVHLDMLYWKPDRTTVSREELDRRIAAVLATDRWIMDGNYSRTQAWRMDAADLVFFFDLPTEVCLAGVMARWGKPRSDIPWVEGDVIDEEFLQSISNFAAGPRKRILEKLSERPQLKVVTFRSHEEVDAYLQANPFR